MAPNKRDRRIADQMTAARELYERGWTLIPVAFRSKKPIGAAWQKMKPGESKLFKQFGKEPRNIGFLTGGEHGDLVDVDVDSKDVDDVIVHFLPKTQCRFGRQGKNATHFLYRCASAQTQEFADPTKPDSQRAMLVELRAKGRFTVAPGSVHDDSDKVVWVDEGHPAEITADALSDAVRMGAACALLARHFPSRGLRHDAILALTGHLVQIGWDPDTVAIFAGLIAEHNDFSDADISGMIAGALDKVGSQPMAGLIRLKEFWPPEVIDRAVKWLQLPAVSHGRGQSDSDLAYEFVNAHIEQIRFLADRQKWLHFNGKIWRIDRSGLVKSLVRQFLQERNTGDDPALGSNHKINSVLDLAKIDQRIALSDAEVDDSSDVLGTPEGIFDLRARRFEERSAKYVVTKSTSVAPDFDADCPIWMSFLNDITQNDRAIRSFLKRWAGYCCTGRTDEQVFLILKGEGENGKSVFQKTIGNILGDYSCTPNDSLFVAGAREPAPIDTVAIEKSRIIQASEPEPGRKWNEGMLKKVTGGERIYHRRHHAEGTATEVTGKLLVTANDLPVPKSIGHAMRRRFLILKIDFVPTTKDPQLDEKLRAEYPAILAWMLKGARRWYKSGLSAPEKVLRERDAYFDENDWILRWLDNCTLPAAGFFSSNEDIAASFNPYIEREGQTRWSTKSISSGLRKRYKPSSSRIAHRKVRGYLGFRIKR